MTSRKSKAPALRADTSFGKTVARFVQTNPAELAETLAVDVLKGRERAKKQVQDARQEIEDGARPRKGRFRL